MIVTDELLGSDAGELHFEWQTRVGLNLNRFDRHRLKASGFDSDVVSTGFEVGDGEGAVVTGVSSTNLSGLHAGDFDLGVGDEGVVGVFDSADDGAFVVLGQGGSGESVEPSRRSWAVASDFLIFESSKY